MADLVTYDPVQALSSRFSKYGREQAVRNAKQKYDELLQSAAAKSLKGRAGMIGAGAAGLGVAANQLLGGEPLGAVAGLGGSVAGGKIGSLIGAPLGAPGRLIGGAIGSVAGGLLFGQGAEYAKAAVTGAGKGKEAGGTEPPAYIPGTNIPLNETARYLESQKAIGNQQLDLYKGYSAADRAGMKDIIQHSMETQIQLSKRLDPIIQQSKDKDMVRTQALMNTQGNIDARLGILATQGALAKGAQAEAGALARTFAGTNPYAQFAVRQSPNIQFG
jgi:hypothetical protein